MSDEQISLSLEEPVQLEVPPAPLGKPYEPQHAELLGSMAALVMTDPAQPPTLHQFNADARLATTFATQENEHTLREMSALVRGERTLQILHQMATEAAVSGALEDLRWTAEDFRAAQTRSMDKYALEKETLSRLEDYGLMDKDGIALAKAIMKNETAADYIRNITERALIVNNAIAPIASEYEDQGTMTKVLQFLGSLIPFTEVSTLANVTKEFFSPTSGTVLRTLQNNIYHADLTPDQLKAGLDNVVGTLRKHSGWVGENKQVLLHLVEKIGAIGESEAGVKNLWDWVELGTTLPFGGAVRASKAGLAYRARARELSKTVTLDSYARAASGEKIGDAGQLIDNILPDAAKSGPTDMSRVAGVSEEVNRTLHEQRTLQANVLRVVNDTVSARTAEETTQILEDMTKEIGKSRGVYVKNAVVDPDNSGMANVLIGKKDGGFISEASAKMAQTKSGLVDSKLVHDLDGRWYISQKFAIRDGAYLQLAPTPYAPSWLRRVFGSSVQLTDDALHGRALQAEFVKSKMYGAIKTMLDSGWKPLKSAERKYVSAVLQRGNIEGKWYSPEEFVSNYANMHSGRLPTEREFLGYYTAKNVNDFDYHVRNHTLYRELLREGWQHGTFEVGDFSYKGNVLVRAEPHRDYRGAFYDVENNKVVSMGEISFDDLKKTMAEKNKVLVQITEHSVFEGQPTNMLLMDARTASFSDLRPNQLKYSEGGHRIYDAEFWVKQARVGTYKTSESKYVLSPLTHVGAKLRKDAQKWATKMEGARLSYLDLQKGKINRADWEEKLVHLGVDPEDFEKWAKKGEIDLHNPFEVVTAEQNLPLGHTKALATDGVIDVSTIRSPARSFLEDSGRLYYSRKGTAKPGPQDDVAELVDPMVSINRGVANAIHLSSYSEYKQRAINGWLNSYGDLLPKNPYSKGMSRFWDDVDIMKLQGDRALLLRAHASREAIKRQLSTGNDYTREWKAAMRIVGGWFEDAAPSVSRKLYDAGSKDPVTALKGMVFDSLLGLGDISQLVIQTQTIAAMSFLNPKNAAKFAYEGFWLRTLAHNHSEEWVNFAAKRSSMDPAEFKAMARTMADLGPHQIGGELITLDHHSVAMRGKTGELIDGARSMGRIPFYEAERLNRIYAYRMAWDEIRQVKDIKYLDTPDGRADLSRLIDKYTNNMMSGSAAYWQKGAWSVPTQFMSYQMRLWENILPAMFGGNKQFSTSEKLRLFMSQAILYGAAGAPLGEYALHKMTEAGIITPETMTQTGYRALAGGFWDSMLYAVSGGTLDWSPSQRMSSAKGLENYVKDLFGANSYGDSSVAKIALGALGTKVRDVTSDAMGVLYDVWVAANTEKVDLMGVTVDSLQRLAENATSYSRAHKAYLVWRYGELINPSSGRAISSATTADGFAALLGIQTREQVNLTWMRDSINLKETEIKEIRKGLSIHRQNYWRAFRDDDRPEMERQLRIINAHLGMYDTQTRHRVLQGVVRNEDLRPMYSEFVTKFMKFFNPNTLPARNTENR